MTVLYPYDYSEAHELSARSFSSSITPNATQRTTLIVAGCYILVIGILWYALFLSVLPLFCTIAELPMNVCRHVPYLNIISTSLPPLSPPVAYRIPCAAHQFTRSSKCCINSTPLPRHET